MLIPVHRSMYLSKNRILSVGAITSRRFGQCGDLFDEACQINIRLHVKSTWYIPFSIYSLHHSDSISWSARLLLVAQHWCKSGLFIRAHGKNEQNVTSHVRTKIYLLPHFSGKFRFKSTPRQRSPAEWDRFLRHKRSLIEKTMWWESVKLHQRGGGGEILMKKMKNVWHVVVAKWSLT